MLFFKYDRSKVFVVTENKPENTRGVSVYSFFELLCTTSMEDWLKTEKTEWIGGF